jgi:hypothetical protein
VNNGSKFVDLDRYKIPQVENLDSASLEELEEIFKAHKLNVEIQHNRFLILFFIHSIFVSLMNLYLYSLHGSDKLENYILLLENDIKRYFFLFWIIDIFILK